MRNRTLSPAGHTEPRGLLSKVAAEAVGTFALVFIGCGAIAVDSVTGSIGHTGIAAAFGLVIMVMVYATGHISGAHFNPAVTIAFAAVGRFPWRQVAPYTAGQIAAALLASACLHALLGPDAEPGVTEVGAHVTLGGAFAVEVALTFFLMFVITSVATDSRATGAMAGWAIGGAVAVGALVGGPLSGASMNPARSLGPALIAGRFESLWLYVAAPILGAALGAVIYQAIRCGGDNSSARGCC